ncbi:dihydropteroate synthase [Anaerotardibacter muris]|uniref:dihydropteroate synthase n=1 Tax=Anaerotardibacter muris TaxID=2941505 RepID=UPI0020419E0D|nr:dihydropteroate synthase [Anaerotardibacter muris]
MIWKCSQYNFDAKMPIIMGILNLTPDSFSDGGAYASTEDAIAHALAMVDEGALIIDVGGESTRPGAEPVTEAEEKERVLEVVRSLAEKGICVSIDTRHAAVAQAAVEAGASIINDVTGFRDQAMVEVAANCDAGLVVMHMGGSDPRTMQDAPHYDDVVAEVRDFLKGQAEALMAHGIDRTRICLDPGPGFGKTTKQTIELMRNFHELNRLGFPTMVAVSRKSYIGDAYHIEDPKERDAASAAEALMACELGASVIRTHNVALTAEALKENLRPYALIGMGCNVALVADEGEEREGKIAMLNKAIGDMCMLPDTQIIDISSYYESEPAYFEDQDLFVNAVVLMRTGLPPQELLGYLQAIENSLGRVRTQKNGPRTCDLDILDYQGYVSDLEVLTLPHPLLLERDFVVKPLLELLPKHELANGEAVTEEQVRYGKAWKC